MDPKRIQKNDNPEARIQLEITRFLEARGWYVKATHGGMFQSGFPDLWVTCKKYGGKWIEVKLPNMEGSRFTKAQKECFPLLIQYGTPIWILTGANEIEYRKLFEYPHGNYIEYALLKGWW